MDREDDRRKVREFLEQLEPSEVRRLMDLFEMQLSADPGMGEQKIPNPKGIENPIPGMALVTGGSK